MQGDAGREGESNSAVGRHWTHLVSKRDLMLRDLYLKHCFANTLSSITEIVEHKDRKGEQDIKIIGRGRIS